jgi:glycosyltransferase involved in cell wall biosynthesis
LNRVLATHAGQVHVRVVNDRRFFDALETTAKSFDPFLPYEEFADILHQCDVALLPLLPTPFNEMKSDLKYLQCAGHGVVALASPTVYDRTIQEGETGFLYRSADELERTLSLLIADRDLRRRVAGNAYRWVRGQRILAQHYRRREAWYRELLGCLPQLNEELRQRLGGTL